MTPGHAVLVPRGADPAPLLERAEAQVRVRVVGVQVGRGEPLLTPPDSIGAPRSPDTAPVRAWRALPVSGSRRRLIQRTAGLDGPGRGRFLAHDGIADFQDCRGLLVPHCLAALFAIRPVEVIGPCGSPACRPCRRAGR